MSEMREMFEVIAEYPWTSVFVAWVGCVALNHVCTMIVRVFGKAGRL